VPKYKKPAMKTIKVDDKTFALSYSEAEIQKSIQAIAKRINSDFSDKNPLLVCVLNGAFMFAADLMKNLTIKCEITFVKLSSYEGTSSTGKVKETLGLDQDITGRTVIVVEDIVETGNTMRQMLSMFETKRTESVHICTLMQKPEKLKVPLNIEYVAMKIPNAFIIGYGFDIDQQCRNLRDIYTLVEK
jgi:hypoxanthine phosphoribosyltransferase